MKYAIVVMDGSADEPLEELGGMTVLEKADIPNADWISNNGRLGLVHNVPTDLSPGSDVAMMSLMGYDPKVYHTGRAPIEAAARKIQTAQSDWIFRCNLVTVADGKMEDYSAGHIDSVQAAQLINELDEKLGSDDITFYPGVSYRHLMVCKEGTFDDEIEPPHNITGEPVAKYLPRGKGGKKLCRLMDQAAELLACHEVNKLRKDLGENPATDIWLWGQGHKPRIDMFRKRFGITAAVISAVDLVRGLAELMGMKIIDVAGATGYLDTNYAGKGQAAISALDNNDLVLVHVEAPDEAGHGGMVDGKIESIERIDELVTGPLLKWMPDNSDQWRIMVLPDHPTPIRTRTHSSEPVPFAMAGTDINNLRQYDYNEKNAPGSGIRIDKGCDLMEYFLG